MRDAQPPHDPDRDDVWLARLRELTPGDGTPPRGRVLRVKFGYNPNSSSVGSVITFLMWSSVAGAAALNLMAVLMGRRAALARDSVASADPSAAPDDRPDDPGPDARTVGEDTP